MMFFCVTKAVEDSEVDIVWQLGTTTCFSHNWAKSATCISLCCVSVPNISGSINFCLLVCVLARLICLISYAATTMARASTSLLPGLHSGVLAFACIACNSDDLQLLSSAQE